MLASGNRRGASRRNHLEPMLTVERIQPRWLKSKDASAYSALSPRRLVDLAKAGQVVGFLDESNRRGMNKGEWIFDRLSLDAYRQSQAGDLVVAVEAVDALRRLGL